MSIHEICKILSQKNTKKTKVKEGIVMKGKIGIARLGFMGKLAAVLVAGVMLACPAMADNAASWSDVRNIINGAGNRIH